VVKDLGPVDTFVGCKIIENKEKDTIWIHQPKLIKNLEEQFGPLVTDMRTYKTPAAPRTNIQRPKKGEILISSEDQTKFRSGVGMLLYLVKHSRPDIANAVRELSKVADGATKDHWNKLLRAIKFTLDTKHLALKMKPEWDQPIKMVNGKPDWASIFETKCTMGATSDSEYSGDKETRQSVFGWELYFMGALIAHKSKACRSVTLSSTEAEYYALSEVTKEVIFAKQVLETMGIKLNLPIKIKADNVGSIYLAKNFSLSQNTKHIDIRRHFVREHQEEGTIDATFIRSEDNEADILTKNKSEEIVLRHQSILIQDVITINLTTGWMLEHCY
jgi:hypothetical protein